MARRYSKQMFDAQTPPRAAAAAPSAYPAAWTQAQLLLAQYVPVGSRIVVAASGGPDSQALLHWSAQAATALRLHHLGGIGIDHGLRPQAQAELQLAAALAQSLQLPFVCVAVQVARTGNLAEQARRSRLRALQQHAALLGATHILLGHTGDDQAETVLWHLARGCGLRGARGMPPRRKVFVRPLLGLGRAQVLAYNAAHHIAFAEDPSNANLQRTRSWLRHKTLPSLCHVAPQARAQLAAFAQIAAEENALLAQMAKRALQRCSQVVHGQRCLHLPQWRRAPKALQPRILQLWLRAFGARPKRLGLQNMVAQLRDAGAEPLRHGALPGALVWRKEPYLFACCAADAPARRQAQQQHLDNTVAPAVLLSAAVVPTMGPYQIGLQHQDAPAGQAFADVALRRRLLQSPCETVAFAQKSLHVGLCLRPWRAGDKLHAFGGAGHVLVSDLLNRAQIPRALRPGWPVVVLGEDIVWVVGVRRSQHAPLVATTEGYVVLTATWTSGLPKF